MQISSHQGPEPLRSHCTSEILFGSFHLIMNSDEFIIDDCACECWLDFDSSRVENQIQKYQYYALNTPHRKSRSNPN